MRLPKRRALFRTAGLCHKDCEGGGDGRTMEGVGAAFCANRPTYSTDTCIAGAGSISAETQLFCRIEFVNSGQRNVKGGLRVYIALINMKTYQPNIRGPEPKHRCYRLWQTIYYR